MTGSAVGLLEHFKQASSEGTILGERRRDTGKEDNDGQMPHDDTYGNHAITFCRSRAG
jgi:hypothetical protein